MKVNILASGSTGNCIALTTNGSTILIDAGIAKTKIEKRLLEVGITPNNIAAIFVTHAHGDHIKGLPLANKYNIPVYAGEEEWQSIDSVDEGLQNKMKGLEIIGKFEVAAFKTHHDSFSPLGYTVTTYEHKASVCLDTGHVDSDMLTAMKGSDTYIIESNHDTKMVELCSRPTSVKVRILSGIGHLSNKQTADALSELVTGKGEEIYLTHLSGDNNIPMLADMTVAKALLAKGLTRNKHYKLEVIV